MNLVFIHGRGQGSNSADRIRSDWIAGLEKGFRSAGIAGDFSGEVCVPFYGKRLEELTDQFDSGAVEVLIRGGSDDGLEADPFIDEYVEALAARAGVTRAQVLATVPVRERAGPFGMTSWLLRTVETNAPWLARSAIRRELADVNVYLHNAFVRREVDAIVLAELQRGPAVVVAHSLGTVVAYCVLAANPGIRPPLLVTAGSPLGLGVIKDVLKKPRVKPAEKWLNVSDADDYVAIFQRLNGSIFVDGIEDMDDVNNGDEPHSIVGYLSDRRVGKRLADALNVT